MATVETANKCPRCAAAVLPAIVGERGAPSRQTMDGGEPIVRVCSECRMREVHRAAAGLRPLHFSEWPAPLRELALEDRILLAYRRQADAEQLLHERERTERANKRE